MALSRNFRGLTSYDLLGNLIPGTYLLLAIIALFPSPPVPTTGGGYSLFVIAAFISGSILQAFSGWAQGNRKSFDKTIAKAEVLSDLTKDSQAGENPTSNATERGEIYWKIIHPLIGPFIGGLSGPRGRTLDDKILVNRIWGHLVDNYEIPYNTKEYSVLYRLMSSKVDDIQSPSRAIRMQAIRNFFRGMWTTSWIVSIVLLVSISLQTMFSSGEQIMPGIVYEPGALYSQILPYWMFPLVSILGIFLFYHYFEYFEEDYIEYLFADYAVGISTKQIDVNTNK